MPRYAVILKLPGGGSAIVCTSRPTKPCAVCGAKLGRWLCDYPLAWGGTCDLPICEDHRHPQGANVDYCPHHHAAKHGGPQP